jgi:hypothetical protein
VNYIYKITIGMLFVSSVYSEDGVLHMEEKRMVPSAAYDVCDLSLIYTKEPGYSYSLPRSVLETFLSGRGFDYPGLYAPDELASLKADINDLYQGMMLNPVRGNIATISAGSPGAGKQHY